jgi:tRNA dimethylallyltransferase
MDLKSKIILIFGPTASGKSNFAIKLAKKIRGEIINADSMQVYRELKILTARPIKKEYQKIKHHLYGFQSVKKKFSTGKWLNLVTEKIAIIKKRKNIPILVGGTGLYFKALTDGLVKIPNIPIKFRNKIRNLQKKLGQKEFFKQLNKLDPLINKKISPTDVQRSIRAYEVKSYTKKSLVDWFRNTQAKFVDDDFIKIYIDFPKEDLLDKISTRVDQMLKQGAIVEVKKFLKLKIGKEKTSNKVIGINEIRDFLNKKSDLGEVKEKITVKTRQYAKRQSTWARGQMMNWQKVNPKDLKLLLKKIKFSLSKT